MTVWNPKAPGDKRLESFDWSEIGSDYIVASSFTPTAGTVTLTEVPHDLRTTYALLSGGVDGETATIEHTITTYEGQEFTREITLRIVADANSLSPLSSLTKGELVVRSLGEIGIANYVFDIEAEEDIAALRKLDSMFAALQVNLRPIGYLWPDTTGNALPSDETGLDEADVEAAVSMLAVALAPSYGKAPGNETKRAAREGRDHFLLRYRVTAEVQMTPRTPVGAGNRWPWRTFFPRRV